MLGELLSVCRRIFGLRPNFLKHSQNSHFDCNDPALIHSSTVHSTFLKYFIFEKKVVTQDVANISDDDPSFFSTSLIRIDHHCARHNKFKQFLEYN